MNRYLLIALAACAVAILLGWQYIGRQSDHLAIATERVALLEEQAKAYAQALTVRDAIDTQYQEAIRHAEDSKPQLVADLDAGVKRVYVRAACVPADPKPAGGTDAAAPELAADARQDYAVLTASFQIVMAQIAGLQDYARTCTSTPRK